MQKIIWTFALVLRFKDWIEVQKSFKSKIFKIMDFTDIQ